MNHPHEDDLLLLTYGELDGAAAAQVERHLAACAPCHELFIRLARSRVAVEWATARLARRVARWTVVSLLAAAAAVAAITLAGRPSPTDRPPGWPRPLQWSTTAGYLAGGRAVIAIDAELTRLEQGWSYARP